MNSLPMVTNEERQTRVTREYPPPTLADAKAALKFIDADCDHDIWVKIGMALKSEFGEDGWFLFDTWSSKGEKYDPTACIDTWASFGEKAEIGESITIGTLFFYAKENGYKSGIIDPNEQVINLPGNKTAEIASAKKAKPAKSMKDISAMVLKATNYWNASKPDVPHPYATTKGYKEHGLRVNDDCLLVSAYNDNNEIQSVQRINSEGKFNLKGCTITGCYHPIKGDAKRIVIVEGWATGMSINQATGYAVAVAFGKTHLARIAALMGLKHPNAELIIAADSDHVDIAREAAAACSGSLAVPVQAKGSADLDFNDMHLQQSLKSVTKIFDGELEKPEPEKTNSSGKISFTPANQIKLKPISWLINKYLEMIAIIFLHGDTESFKTFTCLGIGIAVSSGTEWIPGHGVVQGRVLYICGEGYQGIRRRLEAWSLHHNKPIPDDLYVSDMSTDLGDAEKINELVEAINAMEVKPSLIIVDTFARNFGSGESNNDDIGVFYSNVEHNLVKRYGCSVLATHHPGKDESRGMRGGASLKQNADAVYKVKREDINGEAYTTMTSEKMKDARKPGPVMFKAIKVDLNMQDSFGGESSSLVLEVVNNQTRMMLSLTNKQSTADKANSDRKKLLTLIAKDGSLTQKAYAAQCGFSSQQVVSGYIKWLRKEQYLTGTARKLKVTNKGKAWCAESGDE